MSVTGPEWARCMPPLQSVFIVWSPGRADPDWAASESQQLDRLEERERDCTGTKCFLFHLSFPSFFYAAILFFYIFFIPPLVDASLSFNSLIALSLPLYLLCLYGLTLQLNSVLFGWDGHTIIVLVRRWGFLSLRGEKRVSCFEKPMEGTITEEKL